MNNSRTLLNPALDEDIPHDPLAGFQCELRNAYRIDMSAEYVDKMQKYVHVPLMCRCNSKLARPHRFLCSDEATEDLELGFNSAYL